MSILDAALSYLKDYRFSIIPLSPSCAEEKAKKPLIEWKEFQKRRPTEDEVKAWWKKWPNAMIGIPCGPVSGIFVLDADSEEAKEKLDSELPDSFLCPIVRTPRPGYHYWMQYQNGIRNSNNGLIHCRGEGGYIVAPPSRKDDGRVYTWIVKIMPSLPPPAPPLSLLKLINDNKDLQTGKNPLAKRNEASQSVTSVTISFNKGSRDESLFHIANQLIKSGEREENVRYLLENIAEKICVPPFPLKEIPVKISSALARAHLRERNWQAEVESWVSVTERNWSVTELSRDVTSVTKQDKAAVRMAVKRLKDAGVIEPTGNRNGVYRRVENQTEDIDIFSDSDNPLDLKFPLGIESLVHIMPKSIIIVAGESDAGKTAFLLNFSFLNLDTHAITYFSSEMGPTELKSRIEKFERPLTDWKKVKFKERTQNFQDVIQPDIINIVDYLELTDEFYKVGGQIKAIFDKLKSGIAIIALQKKMGQELARGGDFTMEKARLYISLSRDNICKIIKAKNWVNPRMKPTGKVKSYSLLYGCKFLEKTDWVFEEDIKRVEEDNENKKNRKLGNYKVGSGAYR